MTPAARKLLAISDFARWADRMDTGRASATDMAFKADDFELSDPVPDWCQDGWNPKRAVAS